MIYLDNAATTAVDPRVTEVMLPYFSEFYANPSGSYGFAYKSMEAIDKARGSIANLIGADSDEIFFTSGGTESDNLAVKGAIQALIPEKKHVICSKIEHKAIINSCREMQVFGVKTTYLYPDEIGIIQPEKVMMSINRDTAIVSIMMANNEIGTIEPVEKIGAVCSKWNVLFHTDAVQAFGQIPIDVKRMSIDLMSISSHKIHGPKGIGALYVKKGTKVYHQICGGGQESGLRAGTENVPGIVGFGEAARIAGNEMNANYRHVSVLRDRMIYRVLHEIRGVRLNGAYYYGNNGYESRRLPGNVNFSFLGIKEGSIPMMLDEEGICTSSGSACSTLNEGASHVLKSIGLSDELASSSLRITIGKNNTVGDIDETVQALKKVITKLRNVTVEV